MALSGELAKYVGKELVKSSGKELAKAGARSALSSLVPSVATKIGTDIANKAGAELATKSVLSSLTPVRSNWVGEGDIEGMLNGKFLGANQNYFDNTFSRGALGRATYGPEQALDRNKVAGLVRAIKNNEDIAPIAGFKNDDGLIDIFDGHHRLAAYQKAGKMPRVKLFDKDTKDDAYAFADDWSKNAVKQVEKYLPAKPTNQYGLDENGMGKVDLSSLNEPKIQQSIIDKPTIIYHGTPYKFEDFNEELPSIWFTNNKDTIRDTGLSWNGKGELNIMERELPSDIKLADWDTADRLTHQQLIDRGYDGIMYDEGDGSDIYYEIFNPNKTLKKLETKQPAGYDIVKKYLGEPQGMAATDFNKSKIKDKRGNLLKLYHGTDSDFSEFGNVKTEPGYWFTEDKNYALSHGKNLKTVNLNMVKPLDVTTTDGDNKMWEYARDCFGKENVSEDEIMSNRFRDYLIDKGYDGIIFDHSGKNTYIAFSPEQIKILD